MLSILRRAVIAMEKGKSLSDSVVALTHAHSSSFVEFETAADLKTAVEKLDGREFKGVRVGCTANVSTCPASNCNHF